jgi:hypothetical protein
VTQCRVWTAFIEHVPGRTGIERVVGQKYLRHTRNAAVLLAILFGVGVLFSLIFGVIVGVDSARELKPQRQRLRLELPVEGGTSPGLLNLWGTRE